MEGKLTASREELKSANEKLAVPPLFDDLQDSEKFFGTSKTLETPEHRQIIIEMFKDSIPAAKFEKIYDATRDGWSDKDFYRCCEDRGPTLTIV